jgi:hypothetical protein
VIVATSIAETSITLDGVRFVVDCGFAKLPFFHREVGGRRTRRSGTRVPRRITMTRPSPHTTHSKKQLTAVLLLLLLPPA